MNGWVCKETMLPRRWESKTRKFGIKRVHKGLIAKLNVKSSDEGLTLETFPSLSFYGGSLTPINSCSTKVWCSKYPDWLIWFPQLMHSERPKNFNENHWCPQFTRGKINQEIQTKNNGKKANRQTSDWHSCFVSKLLDQFNSTYTEYPRSNGEWRCLGEYIKVSD